MSTVKLPTFMLILCFNENSECIMYLGDARFLLTHFTVNGCFGAGCSDLSREILRFYHEESSGAPY